MVLIAIDPHKTTHTACALAPDGSELGQLGLRRRNVNRCCAGPRGGPSDAGLSKALTASAAGSRSGY